MLHVEAFMFGGILYSSKYIVSGYVYPIGCLKLPVLAADQEKFDPAHHRVNTSPMRSTQWIFNVASFEIRRLATTVPYPTMLMQPRVHARTYAGVQGRGAVALLL